MPELLETIFSGLCGQNAQRSWSAGIETMPLCARCAGIYIGVLVVFIAWPLALPPRRWWMTAIAIACLAQMIPSGLHLFEQGPSARTVSGYAFGVGLAHVLWLRPGARWSRENGASWEYWILVALAGFGLVRALSWESSTLVYALSWLDLLGLVAITLLVVANVWTWRWAPSASSRSPSERKSP